MLNIIWKTCFHDDKAMSLLSRIVSHESLYSIIFLDVDTKFLGRGRCAIQKKLRMNSRRLSFTGKSEPLTFFSRIDKNALSVLPSFFLSSLLSNQRLSFVVFLRGWLVYTSAQLLRRREGASQPTSGREDETRTKETRSRQTRRDGAE